jgi:hypothetical protein
MSQLNSTDKIPPTVRLQTRIQAASVIGLGLTYLLSPPTFIHSLERSLSHYLPFLPSTPSVPPSILNHPLLAQQQQVAGVIVIGIGSAYAISMINKQDEWIYMSVPARLIIVGAGLLTWLVAPEKVGVTMALIIVNDGLGAVAAAWHLGWDGMMGRKPRGGVKRDSE